MKNLKKSILILSSLIIMVLCSACSKANNYSMSDFVGVYYGENGSVLTLLSNGTSNYYFVSSDNIETTIVAGDTVNADFTNDYNNKLIYSTGVVNHFEYDGTGWEWVQN